MVVSVVVVDMSVADQFRVFSGLSVIVHFDF
jgi:hypothetical protein